MNQMIASETPLSGVFVLDLERFTDNRGSFARLFCETSLSDLTNIKNITQINHSLTCETGSVRGLHFQYPPHAEMKLVRCLKGRVWDVVLDLRAGSKTFLHWFAYELSAENAKMIIVPEGCAHGFQTLEPNCELLYLHTANYAPQSQAGIRPNDPLLNIPWPLPFTNISTADQSHSLIDLSFKGVTI